MKTLAYIFFLSLLASVTYAQDDDIPQQDAKVRDKIEAARVAYITDQLQLTPAEAEKFWPIYREFSQRRKEIRQQLKGAKTPDPSKTDQEAVDEQFKMKQQELDLEKDYSGRLLKVISAQKLRTLPQAERRFRQMILDQIQRRQMQHERQQNLRDRTQQQLQKRNN
jgi:hypothetical protein